MVFVYLIIAIAFIDTFSQLPIIASFAASVGATPLLVGLIIGMYSFANIIGNLLSGVWIDKIGSKIILTYGMVVVGLVLFFYTIVDSAYALIAVRFFHGLAGGFIVPAAFTFLGERNRNGAKKGKSMAFSGAAVGSAAIIGPAMGAIISGKLGYEWLFYIVGALMVLFGFLSFIFLKNFKSSNRAQSKSTLTREDFTFLKSNTIWYAYLSIFLLLFSLGILTYSLPYTVSESQIQGEMTGVLLSVFGIVAILFFVLPTNKIFDRIRKTSLMTIGLFTVSSALALLFFSTSLLHLIGSMIIYGIGFAFLFPSTSATVVESIKESSRGKAFGFFYACFSLGVVAGSFLAGFLSLPGSRIYLVGAFILALGTICHKWGSKTSLH